MTPLLALLASLAFVRPVPNTEVPTGCAVRAMSIKDGNVYLKCKSGVTLAITTDGTSSQAVLSPLNKLVIFVKKSDGPTRALCIARSDKMWQVETLLQLPLRLESRVQREFVVFNPSSDERDVYFLTDYSSTSFLLAKVNVERKTVMAIGTASAVSEISRGTNKGNLVLLQRTVAPNDDPDGKAVVHVYDLVSPNGRVLRVLGENLADVEQYLRLRPAFWP